MRNLIFFIFLISSAYSQEWIKYNENDLCKDYYLQGTVNEGSGGIFVETVSTCELLTPDVEMYTLYYFKNDSYANVGGYEKNTKTGKIKIVPGSIIFEGFKPTTHSMKILYDLIR